MPITRTCFGASRRFEEKPAPAIDPAHWREFLRAALEEDLTTDLAAIRNRQSQHLSRELERVDDYFEHYEQELATRSARTGMKSPN